MTFVVSWIPILLVLYLHALKTLSFIEEVEKSRNEVISLTEVLIKSVCQPRDTLVDIFQEYPEDTDHTYVPSCVVLKRCGGCCSDEAMECFPTETRNISLQVMHVRQMVSQNTIQLSFTEHQKCDCRLKPEVMAAVKNDVTNQEDEISKTVMKNSFLGTARE